MGAEILGPVLKGLMATAATTALKDVEDVMEDIEDAMEDYQEDLCDKFNCGEAPGSEGVRYRSYSLGVDLPEFLSPESNKINSRLVSAIGEQATVFINTSPVVMFSRLTKENLIKGLTNSKARFVFSGLVEGDADKCHLVLERSDLLTGQVRSFDRDVAPCDADQIRSWLPSAAQYLGLDIILAPKND